MDVLDKASQMGLRTLALSEHAGGAGADNLTCCIVTEELAVGDPDFAAVLAQTSTLAHVLFDRAMTPEQREHFLPAFLDDDRYHLALAEHEPDRDATLGINYHRPQSSDAPFKTTAERGGRRVDHQRRQGPRRQRADRRAVCRAGVDRRGREHAAGAARHPRPRRGGDQPQAAAGTTAPTAR